MLVLLRAITYATLFVAFFLIIVPQRILANSGIVRPGHIGGAQIAGLAIAALGAALVVWCLVTFAFVGKGTAAPFDPPRKLVVAGPYARVRNPIYIGAAVAMLGAALFYQSTALVLYAAVVLVVTHLLVVLYEEPHLHRVFGPPYDDYLQRVHRWIPTWRS
jgi:protein-S-isoprenylcysteine O-methyltransferase Ste14